MVVMVWGYVRKFCVVDSLMKGNTKKKVCVYQHGVHHLDRCIKTNPAPVWVCLHRGCMHYGRALLRIGALSCLCVPHVNAAELCSFFVHSGASAAMVLQRCMICTRTRVSPTQHVRSLPCFSGVRCGYHSLTIVCFGGSGSRCTGRVPAVQIPQVCLRHVLPHHGGSDHPRVHHEGATSYGQTGVTLVPCPKTVLFFRVCCVIGIDTRGSRAGRIERQYWLDAPSFCEA